ncbi:MAG TPA: PfkB family carbohydrate kinase [Thermomicrobiaceae bacterium]|nr:PfkB family carbohydrate kinase [Thermomicrobiaceae bacterium]
MVPRAVLCLGEIVIDLIGEPPGPIEATASFAPRVGGAPANVAVGLTRLGVAARFVGAVADDAFAGLALRRLATEGVDVDGVVPAHGAQTRLGVVVGEPGSRGFTFYGYPPADRLLAPGNARDAVSRGLAAVYLGSLPLTGEPSRSALRAAAEAATALDVPICFDPNPRGPQFARGEPARAALVEVARQSTVLKLSRQDLAILGVDRDGVPALAPDARIVVVTDGDRGCEFRVNGAWEFVPPAVVRSRDEVGAGDAFMAALIARGVASGFDYTRDDVAFAAAAGALATTVTGAMDAMPTRDAVERLLAATGQPA